MYGQPMIQKVGINCSAVAGPYASLYWQGSGFMADPASPLAPSGIYDALFLVLPRLAASGTPYSIIWTANAVNAAGNWIFNLCLSPQLPAVTPSMTSRLVYRNGLAYAYNLPQAFPLPTAAASATGTIGEDGPLVFEMDIAPGSSSWSLSLSGEQIDEGALTNILTGDAVPLCAYIQIAEAPPASSLTDIVLQCSVQGYVGAVATLNL